MRADTEMGGSRRLFPTTLWTLVLQARDAASPERREALGQLIGAYWKPVYFFIRRRGADADSGKDLTQGFFTALLEREAITRVDRSAGRFRSFLRASLKNYLADEYDRTMAQKRGGGKNIFSLDFAGADRATLPDDSPERVFEMEWAIQVLKQALDDLRAEYEAAGRRKEFDAFRDHLKWEGDRASHAELAKSLGMSETAVNNGIRAARNRYARAIRDVIRSYVETDEDAREELRELRTVFARS